jgi:hypothetical protein
MFLFVAVHQYDRGHPTSKPCRVPEKMDIPDNFYTVWQWAHYNDGPTAPGRDCDRLQISGHRRQIGGLVALRSFNIHTQKRLRFSMSLR